MKLIYYDNLMKIYSCWPTFSIKCHGVTQWLCYTLYSYQATQ